MTTSNFYIWIDNDMIHESLKETGFAALYKLHKKNGRPFYIALAPFLDQYPSLKQEQKEMVRDFLENSLRRICCQGINAQKLTTYPIVPQIYAILGDIFDYLLLKMEPYDFLIVAEEDEDDCDVGSQDDDYQAEESESSESFYDDSDDY